MAANVRFDEKVTVGLRLDEAIVLLGYLSRETWGRGSSRLERTFDHPAESHGVQDLLQQSFAQLVYVGTERTQGMDDAARDSLLQRYSDDEG